MKKHRPSGRFWMPAFAGMTALLLVQSFPKRRRSGSDEMRTEYDFSRAVRGKYYKRVLAGTNVIILDPDVAENFKNSRAVNKALRSLLRVTAETSRLTARSSGRGKKRRAA